MIHWLRSSVISGLVALLLISAVFSGFAQDSSSPGFGLQPGIVPPKNDPQTLPRRILSTTPYRLTPGDAYELVVVLEKTERYPLILGLDYRLDIPYIGTLNVKEMYFDELKQQIVSRIKGRIPVQFVDFLLTAPALFDVFIYGGVKSPGIATVNPHSRISDVILLAGGLVEGATFRQIELVRDGQSRTVDLSKYATQADFDQNPVLQPDDKIYVPQAQKIVEVKGQVKYPGVYEVVAGETLETVLSMAGGATIEGRARVIQILRQEADGTTVALSVDRTNAGVTELMNADVISVGSGRTGATPRIAIDGALYGEPLAADKPAKIPQDRVVANIPFIEKLTLLDILDQLGGPTPLAEWDRSYVQRESGEKIPVMLRQLWENRDLQFDIQLKAGDLVVVPMKAPKVFVAGEVNDAGAIPFSNGYTVSDYIVGAGGINPDTGTSNRIYFVDESGGRQRVTLETSVEEPGTLIYVGKNSWAITEKSITRILILTGFVSAIVAIISDLADISVNWSW
jgi:polysaccharide export outer membrane protein